MLGVIFEGHNQMMHYEGLFPRAAYILYDWASVLVHQAEAIIIAKKILERNDAKNILIETTANKNCVDRRVIHR